VRSNDQGMVLCWGFLRILLPERHTFLSIVDLLLSRKVGKQVGPDCGSCHPTYKAWTHQTNVIINVHPWRFIPPSFLFLKSKTLCIHSHKRRNKWFREWYREQGKQEQYRRTLTAQRWSGCDGKLMIIATLYSFDDDGFVRASLSYLGIISFPPTVR